MVVMNAAMHDDINVPTQESHYDKKGIVLQPFLHQVSGRAAILSLDKTTVCKPLNYREHKFYKSLPPDIMEFTPRYKGIVNVNVEETEDGSVALTAYPSKSLEDEASSTSSSSSQHESYQVTTSSSSSSSSNATATATKTTKRRSPKHHVHHHHSGGGGAQQQQEPTSFFPQLLQQVCTKSSSTSSLCDVAIAVSGTKQATATSGSASGGGIARRDSTTTVNPWTFKVQREGLRRYLQSEQRTQKCILLENVASKFRKPCILDLKMGTRIHGDYDDRDKRLRHQIKSAATTTKKLGIRLCGMQVYDARTNSFHCRDKYFGRTLDRSALKSALSRFFHATATGASAKSGSDAAAVKGSVAGEMISTVIERLRVIRDSLNRLGSYRFYSSSLLIIYDGDVSSKTGGDNSGGGGSVAASSSQDHHQQQQRRHLPHHRNKVDIRMVDFAKSTNRYLDGSVVHEGPDLGYIFGLTNLITLLGEIAVGKNSSSSSQSSSSEEEVDEEEIC